MCSGVGLFLTAGFLPAVGVSRHSGTDSSMQTPPDEELQPVLSDLAVSIFERGCCSQGLSKLEAVRLDT